LDCQDIRQVERLKRGKRAEPNYGNIRDWDGRSRKISGKGEQEETQRRRDGKEKG